MQRFPGQRQARNEANRTEGSSNFLEKTLLCLMPKKKDSAHVASAILWIVIFRYTIPLRVGEPSLITHALNPNEFVQMGMKAVAVIACCDDMLFYVSSDSKPRQCKIAGCATCTIL